MVFFRVLKIAISNVPPSICVGCWHLVHIDPVNILAKSKLKCGGRYPERGWYDPKRHILKLIEQLFDQGRGPLLLLLQRSKSGRTYSRIAVAEVVHVDGGFRYRFVKGDLPFFAG